LRSAFACSICSPGSAPWRASSRSLCAVALSISVWFRSALAAERLSAASPLSRRSLLADSRARDRSIASSARC
jgi:hypothetical protein